jgi:pyruvate dehydrogenase phosphatase
MAAMMVDIFW